MPYKTHILPHNNAAKLASSNLGFCMSSQQECKVYPPHPQVYPPAFEETIVS